MKNIKYEIVIITLITLNMTNALKDITVFKQRKFNFTESLEQKLLFDYNKILSQRHVRNLFISLT